MNLIKKLKLKQGTKEAWNTIKRVDKKLLKKKAESAGVFAKKHGKKVGGIAVKSAVATASALGPAKKIKLVGKGIKLGKKGYKVIAKSGTVKGITKDIKKAGKAVSTGVKILKESKQKGSVARNVYAGTIKKVKKAVRSDTGKKVRKVAGKTYKGFQGTIMVGGLAPLVPISLGIMGAKAGTKLAVKHGGKAIKSLKAKLKNIYKDPK